MKTKRKGSRNEHKSMTLLESAGYRCTRSAASLGVFDIVCISAADVVLVQTKTNRWPNRKEMERLKRFLHPPCARRLIHRWRDRQRMPDVKEL